MTQPSYHDPRKFAAVVLFLVVVVTSGIFVACEADGISGEYDYVTQYLLPVKSRFERLAVEFDRSRDTVNKLEDDWMVSDKNSWGMQDGKSRSQIERYVIILLRRDAKHIKKSIDDFIEFSQQNFGSIPDENAHQTLQNQIPKNWKLTFKNRTMRLRHILQKTASTDSAMSLTKC